MQRLLQLPGALVRPGAKGATGPDQEATSPVLAPEGGPPPWYQALQPEELQWLQAPEEEATPEASLEGPSPEAGQGQSQSQPLRYRGTWGMSKVARDGQLLLSAHSSPVGCREMGLAFRVLGWAGGTAWG